ncbi:MAG TPA: hypothetical protein VGP33_13205 [Chloroflexota bacterium]|nr:hypothetical protein [Chloroflexota bacterium]
MPFAGFDPPESNFWRLPNNWFDLAAHFTSWAEHKVVEYILRHTWGYHEYDMVKLITMDEFMHGRKRRDGSRLDAGCGMAENSIKKGINDAVAHGFLIVRIDDSDKGRIKKYYAPRMRAPHADRPLLGDLEGQTLTLRDQILTPGGQAHTPGAHSLTLSPAAVDPPTEQTPPARHVEQETDGNNTSGHVVALPVSSAKERSREQAPGAIEHQPTLPASAGRNRRQAGHQARTAALAEPAPPFRADLVGRLVAEGIAPARARALVASTPPERIERQLGWIDHRSCRNRPATLIRAIEEDFGEPIRRPRQALQSSTDEAKYFRGSYALCPHCGSRPCVGGCGSSG